MKAARRKRVLSVDQADELIVRIERRLNLLAKLLYDNGAGDAEDTLTHDEEITLSEYLEDLRDDAKAVHAALVAADPIEPPPITNGQVVARLHALCAPFAHEDPRGRANGRCHHFQP